MYREKIAWPNRVFSFPGGGRRRRRVIEYYRLEIQRLQICNQKSDAKSESVISDFSVVDYIKQSLFERRSRRSFLSAVLLRRSS